MSTQTIQLGVINSRQTSPYRFLTFGGAGTDDLKITAGKNWDVPNHWRLNNAYFSLTTDATVAARKMVPYSRHIPTNRYCFFSESDDVTASSTEDFLIFQGGGAYQTGLITIDHWLGIGKDACILFGDDLEFRFYVNTGKAGDTWYCTMLWQYMNWELELENPYLSAWDRWAGRYVKP